MAQEAIEAAETGDYSKVILNNFPKRSIFFLKILHTVENHKKKGFGIKRTAKCNFAKKELNRNAIHLKPFCEFEIFY